MRCRRLSSTFLSMLEYHLHTFLGVTWFQPFVVGEFRKRVLCVCVYVCLAYLSWGSVVCNACLGDESVEKNKAPQHEQQFSGPIKHVSETLCSWLSDRYHISQDCRVVETRMFRVSHFRPVIIDCVLFSERFPKLGMLQRFITNGIYYCCSISHHR